MVHTFPWNATARGKYGEPVTSRQTDREDQVLTVSFSNPAKVSRNREYGRPDGETLFESRRLVVAQLWTQWAQQFATLKTRIDSMTEEYDLLLEEALLPNDWDGDGAIQVSGPAAAIAGRILFNISRLSRWREISIPDNITSLGNGGIFMDWNLPHRRLELFIGDDANLVLVTVEKRDGVDVGWITTRGIPCEDFIDNLHRSCIDAGILDG